jgi:SAM-dependent methyltransferase
MYLKNTGPEMTQRYYLNESTVAHSHVQRRFARKLIAEDFSCLDSNSAVLEIGPGHGHFAQECLTKGFQYCAVEGSKILREELEEKGINVIDGHVPPFPVDSEKYDLFFAGMVIEHMPDHVAVTRFVEEIFRILRPGGRACLLFPNAYACGRLLWEMDYSHRYFATPRRIKQLCGQIGFTIVRSDRIIGWFWVRSTPPHHAL